MRASLSSLVIWIPTSATVVLAGCGTTDEGAAQSSLQPAASPGTGSSSPPSQVSPNSTAVGDSPGLAPSSDMPNPGSPPPAANGGSGPPDGDGDATSGGGGQPSVSTDGGRNGMNPEAGGEPGIMNPGAGGGENSALGGGGATSATDGGDGGANAPGGGAGSPPDDTGDAFGPDIEGPCTASEPANSNASGSGPHDVVVETNSDPGINEGTIFRPADLGGGEPYPIFVWGEGGCSQNGLSNAAAMAEIASHGYFIVADGTPNGSGSRSMNSNDIPSMGEPLLAYVEWAIAENSKPCSAYYHSLDASKVAANGFSCGGLMSTGTAGDPRITTWGSTSSGTLSADQALYDSIHTPVLIVEGGPSDIAYENGLRDYDNISPLGHPIMFFSKDIGHGGDLFEGGDGDFTKINLAWLNWWLKGDEGATGKGVLVGDGCSYCSDAEWEVMSANLP